MRKYALPTYLVDKQPEFSVKSASPRAEKIKPITPQVALRGAIESMDAGAIAAAVAAGADPCGAIKPAKWHGRVHEQYPYQVWTAEFSKRRNERGEDFDAAPCLDALDALDEAGAPIYSDFVPEAWGKSDAKARRLLIAASPLVALSMLVFGRAACRHGWGLVIKWR